MGDCVCPLESFGTFRIKQKWLANAEIRTPVSPASGTLAAQNINIIYVYNFKSYVPFFLNMSIYEWNCHLICSNSRGLNSLCCIWSALLILLPLITGCSLLIVIRHMRGWVERYSTRTTYCQVHIFILCSFVACNCVNLFFCTETINAGNCILDAFRDYFITTLAFRLIMFNPIPPPPVYFHGRTTNSNKIYVQWNILWSLLLMTCVEFASCHFLAPRILRWNQEIWGDS
jgi:hypothetical protein